MPDYTIRDPQSGRTLTVRGDSPPTEAELEQLFAQPDSGTTQPKQGETGIGMGGPMLEPVMDNVRAIGSFATRAAGTALSDMAAPILHPIETLQGAANMAKGAYGLATGDQETWQGAKGMLQAIPGQLANMDREGAADLVGHVGAMIVGPKMVKGAINAPGNAMQRGSLRLMQSALKPTKALENARRGAGYGSKEAIAQAVLDEGRIVSRGSFGKAQSALDATDDAAHAAIKGGAGAGFTVDTARTAQAIGGAAQGPVGLRQINAAPDVAAIQGVREAFVNNPLVSDPVGGMAPMSPEMAHEFMTNTGKNLKGKFGRLGGATVEAEKAGRADLSAQLRSGIPELEPLWKAEAKQMTVRDAIADALDRTANRDPIGLGGIVGAVKNPALAVTAMADRSALLKSLIAQALNHAPKLPGWSGSAASNALRTALLSRLGVEPDQEP